MKRIASRFALVGAAMAAALSGHLLGTALRAVRGSAFSAVAFLSLFVGSARADIKTLVEGNRITWNNEAGVIYLLGGTKSSATANYDEIVIQYTNTVDVGSLTIDADVKAVANILLVGGGGAGGSGGGAANNDRGAGGGGGAGGFLFETDYTLNSGTYTVNVGTGGLAAAEKSIKSGGDGGSTLLKIGSTTILEAYGGGGGGAESEGHGGDKLGSGGGGSRYYSSVAAERHACAGGESTTGQGNDGGEGSVGRTAGGGGGAGKPGGDGTTANIGGSGGNGAVCGITGEDVVYAGGGGGGTRGASSESNLGAPGDGGGGRGAGKDYIALPGVDGLGGGGGGGTLTLAGASGGSGIGIIRITFATETVVDVPIIADKTYTGGNIIGFDPGIAYAVLGGDTNGTDVSTYTFEVKPADDFTWKDGTTSSTNISWKIVRREIPLPAVVPDLVYDGTRQDGIVFDATEYDLYCDFTDDSVISAVNGSTYSMKVALIDKVNTVWADGTTDDIALSWSIAPTTTTKPKTVENIVYSGTNSIVFTEYDGVKYVSGTTNSVNAGSFEYTVALDNPAGYTNYVWAGESGDASVENVKIDWSVASQPVEVPKAKTDLVYSNEPQDGFAALDWSLYELASGTTNETAGGTHQATFRLTGNGEAVNYVWSDPSGSSSDLTVSWTIAAAANEITHLALTGWRIGTEPNDPDINATWGTNTVHYSYGRGESEESVTDWIASPYYVAEPGTWVLKAVIPENSNWAAATGTTTFVMWDDPGILYHNWTEISIKGATTELTNFVVPVRISEELMQGFYYENADPSKLVFVDKFGNLLSYDVDTWDESGESVVWLKLPTLPTDGTTVTMYWNLREGQIAPANEPTDVWSDYAGVWHMTDASDSAAGASHGTLGNRTTSVDGILGGALSASQTGEPLILATASDAVNAVTGGAFTVSFYTKYNSTTHGTPAQYLFSRRSKLDDAGYALCINGGLTSTATQFIECFGAASGRYSINDATPMSRSGADKWVRNDVVYTWTDNRIIFYWYINGEDLHWTRDTDMSAGLSNGTTGLLGIGGLAKAGSDSNINGAMDEFRIRAGEPDINRIAAEYASVTNSEFVTSGVVYEDGLKVDYWIVEPSLKYPDMLVWDIDPAKGTQNEIETVGELRYGEVTNYIYSIYDESEVYSRISEITKGGTYRAVFARVQTEDFLPIEKVIEFRITQSKPYFDIGGNGGDTGRILLMNNHIGDPAAADIDYQGWWDSDNAGVNSSSTPTYWHHENLTPPSSSSFNLKDGTESILFTKEQRKLWHLINCRHGNTYPSSGSTLVGTQSYLPYKATYSKRINEHRPSQRGATLATVGQLVMQNTTNAVVYSSCFTNGIGTIYFDAVNGWTGVNGHNNIVVEVATRTVDGQPPTDDKCWILTTNVVDGVEVVDTNWYGKLDETCWNRYTMHPFVITNGVGFVETNSTNELSLQMNIGGRADSFYRVVVPIDYQEAVRFRIRRTSHNADKGIDVSELILLDNIIASPPAMDATLFSPGRYDGTKTGKQVAGWEHATSVAYPSVEDSEVTGWAVPEFYVNSADGKTYDTGDFFNSATMHYRWRYLDQITNAWQAVGLNVADGFKTLSAIDLPGRVGDVEYWYEYTLQAPYYSYVDYSGIGKAMKYTEERGTVTNAYNSAATLPSGGTNWFFRVREGASRYEKMALTVDDRSSGAETPQREVFQMDLVGSHQWRGFVPVTNKTERALSFFITGENPQEDGATEFDGSGANNDEFRASVETIDISSAPFAGTMVKVGEEVGHVASIHYQTNVASYIEFQFNDETRAISISHADYQDFNTWFSSRCEDDANLLFYSSAHETNSTTIATKRYPAAATNKVVETFAETPRTATAWYEPFALTEGQSAAGFPKNAPFQSERTPKGWLADQGMWVAQKWGMTNSTDFALQLEGRGKGSVTFNLTPTPNGLDTIEFSTRLAQFNEFKNVSFSWEQIMRRNYTIAAQACFDTDPQFANFSGEASVSLFSGYVPYTGGYEYRISIYNIDETWKTGSTTYQRACVRHAIYKWHVKDGKLVDELLVEVLDNEAAAGGWFWTSTNKTKAEMVKELPLGLNGTQYSGIYMSFSNANDKVYITAGVSSDMGAKENQNVDFKYTDKDFQQIGCEDSTPVTTFGTYGVLIKNCPGRVLYPRIYEGKTVPIPTSGATDITGGKRWKGDVSLLAETGFASEHGKIGTYWAKDPGRVVELSGDPWGLVADTNIVQDIGVYTMPVGTSSGWTCLTNISVATFNNDKHVIELQSTKPSHVKFASSGDPDDIRTDIVIDGITLTQWCGQSGSSTNAATGYGYADDFYYTGAWISNRVDTATGSKPITNRVALLAPRRAESSESPIGIRSPYMNGLGAIIFDYCDAGEDAELELQVWTGGISYLYGHLEDPADKAGWTTLTNWTFTAGESGTKSYYYGLRTPSNGVFRLVIPQDKVREAYAHGEYDPNWAALTIKDVYCYDEPAFDSHSWWGWNFLTTGWNDGQGNMYAAIDDSKEGAAGVLNNTLATGSLVTGNANDYTMNDPFIQSPTFNNRNVGEIAFRARAYEVGKTSYITVWGAKAGDMQKGASWTAITNVPVDSASYTRHTVKLADEQGFAAIRLGVANVPDIMPDYTMKPASAAVLPTSPVRVLVDEIVIRERVKPEVGFRLDFVRPFRTGLSERTAIANIASRDQQPLLNEQFGFQAEVEVTGLSDEVDLSRIPEVLLSIYPKAEPWGYANWKEADGAVLDILLEPAEGTNLVFRSMSTTPLSFAGPFEADPDLGYGMVQYYLTVKYWDKGGDAHTSHITAQQWQMPSWYQGFDDPNEKPDAKFSPFTVLDTVSPGRAWFNEVNFSDADGSNAKQFIEICFPAGYDMTGWRIYRYDVWGTLDLLANIGLTTGVPATKDATGGDPNFAFLALTSSKAAHPDADAYWSSDANPCAGTDSYGFQLVRPSGIVEQQVVVQGKLGSSRYSNTKLGTNVVAQLETLVGGTWGFVGADTNTAAKSSGVFQNAGQSEGDWNDIMDMTPCMLNCPGQIPSDWFLPPSGTNVWLSLSTLGNLVWIVDGEDRVTAKTIVVPQGTTTNLVFETAPWHQLGPLMRDTTNDVTSAAVWSSGTARTNVWTYAFREDEKNSSTLAASAKPDEDVLRRGGLDPADPYTPAVMNWLLGGMANGEPFEGDEISTNCFFLGLSAGARPIPLPLKDRYWLDIDPTSDAWDLRGGMGDISNLNAPEPTVPVVAEVRRDRPQIWPERLTNRVVTVALMISNKVDNARSRTPNRLQGLGGEKSDVVGARNWTSETFKVTMSLIKPEGASGIDVRSNYWPMASFVFDANSFGAPDGPHPFSARIEVSDPMTKASPAYTYGWWKFPGSTYGYKWDLSHGTYMRDPDVLSTTNTWDKTWEANSDW